MAAQAQVKQHSEHEPLPPPNTDFYEVTETLNAEERALLKQVRAFMKDKVAPSSRSTGPRIRSRSSCCPRSASSAWAA